jgi:hypothetical protein
MSAYFKGVMGEREKSGVSYTLSLGWGPFDRYDKMLPTDIIKIFCAEGFDRL